MTTKPNDSKPSERIRQLLDEARDLCPEDTEAVVMSGAIVAYLDEQHAAGQGERESVFSEANKKRAWDSAIESLAAKGVDVDDLLKRGAEAIRLLPVSRVEGAAEAKPYAFKTICPCTLAGPCEPNCTCADPLKSGGCRCCATYGDADQRKGMAEYILELLRAGFEAIKAAADHRAPPRNPSAAFGSDDCATCGGLRRVRKGDRGLWELCPECWAKDGAEHGPVAEPPPPESLPHRAGLPLPVDADEPPIAGEYAVWPELMTELRNLAATHPATEQMLGLVDAFASCGVAIQRCLAERKSKLASVEAELQSQRDADGIWQSQMEKQRDEWESLAKREASALAEAKARAERLEALANRLILSASPETASELGLQEGTAEPPVLLYPNGPDLALQNPPGYVCWKCGARPKPQTVLDPSQPEDAQPVEGVAVGALKVGDRVRVHCSGSVYNGWDGQVTALDTAFPSAPFKCDFAGHGEFTRNFAAENLELLPPATPEPVTGEKP